MLNALQQKADHENVREIVEQLAQAAGLAGDSIATFAKRSLIGKCASCDTPVNADPSQIKRSPPVSCKEQLPSRRSPGADVSIRQPESDRRPSTALGTNPPRVLPKL